MDMSHANRDVAIAVMAKAPIPGLAKTRLIPALGADGAARLQARFITATVETALAVGSVTLWATPDDTHAVFRQFASRLSLARQVEGDLGTRMNAAIAAATPGGPIILVGTDCPALTAEHLRAAADGLQEGIDAVVIPTEDGGYGLIGLNAPEPRLFEGMAWSTATVMAETRRRLAQLNLSWREPAQLWDVDTPDDLERMRLENMAHLLSA
jgi:rSAM/selenodomain-associated transferase 1